MKIALFGAGGTIGQRIAREALDRGHQVTAVVRDPSRFDRTDGKFSVAAGGVIGESRISAEDYATALVDEVENPRHLRQRMTVPY